MGQEMISLGACATCGGPGQFIDDGQGGTTTRHVDLAEHNRKEATRLENTVRQYAHRDLWSADGRTWLGQEPGWDLADYALKKPWAQDAPTP